MSSEAKSAVKRKIQQISVDGLPSTTAATANAQTSVPSRRDLYDCMNCGELPASSFSKSKLNQYDRMKITVITCNVCTSKAVKDDEEGKVGAKKLRIQMSKEIVIEERQIQKAKKSDPSALYISNPLEAPIISDAVQYFQQKSLIFKIHLGRLEGWRTVAKLAVRGEVSKGSSNCDKITTSIGLFQPGTHRVIKCLESDAHHPSINLCVGFVAKACSLLGINGYIEGTGSDKAESFLHKTYLKYIIMAVERKTTKVQLSLVWNTKPSGNDDGDILLKRLVENLSNQVLPTSEIGLGEETVPLFHSIWVNYNCSSRYNNAITCHDDDSWSLLYGSAHIKEIVTTDMRKPPKLRFPPLVFRQANIDAFSNIIRNIRMWIKAFVLPAPNDTSVDLERLTHTDDEGNEEEKKDTSQAPLINCVELYGGVGTIGLNCLDLFSSLHCSDENPNNKVCFDSTLAKMSSSIRTRAVYESKGASTIASSGGLRGYDIVIVDPPRKGLDDDVIDALLAYYPDTKRARGGLAAGCDTEHGRQNNSRLIYVSCGFKAFKRDMSRLTGEGVEGVSNGESDRVDASYFIPKVGIDGSGSSDVANNSSEGNKKRTRLWKIIHAEGHVLFPGSDHIETFAILDRV